jgi:hypothetical protein
VVHGTESPVALARFAGRRVLSCRTRSGKDEGLTRCR